MRGIPSRRPVPWHNVPHMYSNITKDRSRICACSIRSANPCSVNPLLFVSLTLLPHASNMVTTHVPSIWTAPTRPTSTSDSSRQSNLNPASRDTDIWAKAEGADGGEGQGQCWWMLRYCSPCSRTCLVAGGVTQVPLLPFFLALYDVVHPALRFYPTNPHILYASFRGPPSHGWYLEFTYRIQTRDPGYAIWIATKRCSSMLTLWDTMGSRCLLVIR